MHADKKREQMKRTAREMVLVLEAELAALHTWQSAKNRTGGSVLPGDIWDGMTISIDKIENVLRKAGISFRACACKRASV
jgi:hypothetical protein